MFDIDKVQIQTNVVALDRLLDIFELMSIEDLPDIESIDDEDSKMYLYMSIVRTAMKHNILYDLISTITNSKDIDIFELSYDDVIEIVKRFFSIMEKKLRIYVKMRITELKNRENGITSEMISRLTETPEWKKIMQEGTPIKDTIES